MRMNSPSLLHYANIILSFSLSFIISCTNCSSVSDSVQTTIFPFEHKESNFEWKWFQESEIMGYLWGESSLIEFLSWNCEEKSCKES